MAPRSPDSSEATAGPRAPAWPRRPAAAARSGEAAARAGLRLVSSAAALWGPRPPGPAAARRRGWRWRSRRARPRPHRRGPARSGGGSAAPAGRRADPHRTGGTGLRVGQDGLESDRLRGNRLRRGHARRRAGGGWRAVGGSRRPAGRLAARLGTRGRGLGPLGRNRGLHGVRRQARRSRRQVLRSHAGRARLSGQPTRRTRLTVRDWSPAAGRERVGLVRATAAGWHVGDRGTQRQPARLGAKLVREATQRRRRHGALLHGGDRRYVDRRRAPARRRDARVDTEGCTRLGPARVGVVPRQALSRSSDQPCRRRPGRRRRPDSRAVGTSRSAPTSPAEDPDVANDVHERHHQRRGYQQDHDGRVHGYSRTSSAGVPAGVVAAGGRWVAQGRADGERMARAAYAAPRRATG